jgi:hypothetical protein
VDELATTLRDLARRVDVRVPILPPPGLAPALLAAADELDRLARKQAGMQAEVQRLRPVVDAAQAMRRALDGVS